MLPDSPALSVFYPRQRPGIQIRFHTTHRMIAVNGDYAIGYARHLLDTALANAFLPFLGPAPGALRQALLQIFPHNSPVERFLDKPYAHPALVAYFSTAGREAALCHAAQWRFVTDIRQATAAQIAAPVIQLLIRLAHDGAQHPYIDTSDRLAIATLLQEGLRAHLLPEEDGWSAAGELLTNLQAAPGPVVISSSHGTIFPNLGASVFELSDTDPDGAAWCALTEEERFDYSLLYLLDRPGRQIHPQAPSAIDEISIYELVHPLHRAAKRAGVRIFR